MIASVKCEWWLFQFCFLCNTIYFFFETGNCIYMSKEQSSTWVVLKPYLQKYSQVLLSCIYIESNTSIIEIISFDVSYCIRGGFTLCASKRVEAAGSLVIWKRKQNSIIWVNLITPKTQKLDEVQLDHLHSILKILKTSRTPFLPDCPPWWMVVH